MENSIILIFFEYLDCIIILLAKKKIIVHSDQEKKIIVHSDQEKKDYSTFGPRTLSNSSPSFFLFDDKGPGVYVRIGIQTKSIAYKD